MIPQKKSIRKTILCSGFFLLLLFSAHAQTGFTPVIIDTDCAPDDLRAICLFAAIREIDLLAITSSDGALSPDNGVGKISQIIPDLFVEEIPLAAGRELNIHPPEWREFCENVPWSENPGSTAETGMTAVSLITSLLSESETKITFICLGSLTNLYDVIQESPELLNNIERVIWYNDALNPLSGTNYERDPEAAEVVLSRNLNISVISNLGKNNAAFTMELLQQIASIETQFAQTIFNSHSSPPALEQINSRHMTLWDDLLPVFFVCPDCFDMKPDKTNPNISMTTDYDLLEIKRKIVDILSQQYDYNRHIMFDKFPLDPEIYRSDVIPVALEIIKKHGKDEWRICVLTNEMHGHLGVYSIVGAKMGLKAREWFSAGVDQLTVVSYAGNRPPLSCLNDGLQVSTGATMGQGTITVSSDKTLLPKACFRFEGKTIEMELKYEYREQVESDISQGIVQYGNLTSGYWKLIRRLGLKYWKEWDRNEMFTITVLE